MIAGVAIAAVVGVVAVLGVVNVVVLTLLVVTSAVVSFYSFPSRSVTAPCGLSCLPAPYICQIGDSCAFLGFLTSPLCRALPPRGSLGLDPVCWS